MDNMPLFHGRFGERIDDWLFILENNMKLQMISDSMKLTVATNYLRDAALYLLIDYQATHGVKDWPNFKLRLKAMFEELN